MEQSGVRVINLANGNGRNSGKITLRRREVIGEGLILIHKVRYPDRRELYAHLLEPLLEDQTLSLEFLCDSLSSALSSDINSRRFAVESLTQAASNHSDSFPLALLHVVASFSSSFITRIVDDKVRCAAAIRLKHHVSSYLHTIPPLERNYIKSLIFCLMLSLPSHNNKNIQLHLRQAMDVMCNNSDTFSDFDDDREHRKGLWHGSLLELVSKLRHATTYADPIELIVGLANQIINNFQQHPSWTGNLFRDLKLCFHRYFVRPVVEIFLQTASSINSLLSSTSALTANAVFLSSLLHTQRLCYGAIVSSSIVSVCGHLDEWMTNSLNYLVNKYPGLKEEEVDELRLAVLDYFTIALSRQNPVMEPYVKDMSLPVVDFLEDLSSSASSSRDLLIVLAINCLMQMLHYGFALDHVLDRIFTNIVIPNVYLTEEDEELFQTNHAEFIRREEMQLTNCHTRRGLTIQLLRHLLIIPDDSERVISTIIPNEIEIMLKSFEADPTTNWKRKQCAICLIFYLLSESSISLQLSYIFDVQSFFENHIVPELLDMDVNKFPMLKAAVLKFYSIYCNQVPLSVGAKLNANVLRFLASASIGVRSYATDCIQKLLSVQADVIPWKAKDTATADIVPYQPNLLMNLFGASNLPQPEENVFFLESIIQLIGIAGIPNEIVKSCISWLALFLREACAKPKTPPIYYHLYELLAACVRQACELDPALLPFFEAGLLPILLNVVENNTAAMLPNLFKILVQFVELSRQPMLPDYLKLLEHVLSPELWKSSGHVQFLVVLVEAFLDKASYEFTSEGRLIRLLDIIDLLFSFPHTEKMGYRILIALLQKLGYGVFASLATRIWSSLLMCLQGDVTMEFSKYFVLYMSLFLLKHGTVNLENSMNAAQQNVFPSIVEGYWIPCLKLMKHTPELRLCLYASTMLLSESPTLLDAGGAKLWGALLNGILKLILELKQCEVEGEPETLTSWDIEYLSPTFVFLDSAGDKKKDIWKKMEDPREFLLASLVKLSALSPGRYPIIIKESLDAVNQVALRQLCDAYDCSIV